MLLHLEVSRVALFYLAFVDVASRPHLMSRAGFAWVSC